MKLSELKIGESAYIVEVNGDAAFARRLSELGFIRGEKIYSHMKAPLQDPVEYEILDTTITLRNSESQHIIISKEPIPKTTSPLNLYHNNSCSSSTTNINTLNTNNNDSINDFIIPTEPYKCYYYNNNKINKINNLNNINNINTNTNFNTNTNTNTNINTISSNQNNSNTANAIHDTNTTDDNEIGIDTINERDGDSIITFGNNNINSTDRDEDSISIETQSLEDFNDNLMEPDETTPIMCRFCPEALRCKKNKYYILSNIVNRKWNGKQLKVALIGNPNCGKTTLFNYLSGSHEKEGNYCGVTVDSKTGKFIHNGVKIILVDLPGTYSLASYSPEEKYVEEYLNNNEIDVILNVLDSNNLERNLYLTLQVQKIGIPMVGALNMYDELEKRGDSIDTTQLSQRFGMKFMPTTSKYGKGLKELFDEVLAVQGTLPKFTRTMEQLDTENVGECYAFIHQMLSGIYSKSKTGKNKITSRIDAIVTHRWIGFVIFACIIYIMFGLTFDWLGNPLMDAIDDLFDGLRNMLRSLIPEGWFQNLVVDGIIAGVGGVIVFIPNILILYACVSILEDSGYMARAAFILDRIMRVFGLHGKSFIPMICGFGCNVPAIMSTRAIENRKSRLVTILVTSLFSCSARTPVYNVLANAFFPHHVTEIIFSLYAIGVTLALILAKLFSVFLVKEKEMNYLMELPEYRIPSIKSVLRHTWERCKEYVKKMATVILAASLVIWVLSNFPRVSENDTITQTEKSYLGQIGKFIQPVFEPMGSTWQMDVSLLSGLGAKEIVVSTLSILYSNEEEDNNDDNNNNNNDNNNNDKDKNKNNRSGENKNNNKNKNKNSNDHQKKNNGDDDTIPSNGLSERLKNSGDITSRSAYAYMLFVLLYFPCVATVTAIGHEAGWKWAGFVTIYTTVIAWIVATSFYQISGLIF